MQPSWLIFEMIAAVGLVAVGTEAGSSQESPRSEKPPQIAAESTPAPQQAQRAIGRSLEFLEKDAVKWREERGCATCHHGTMTVWALGEAKSQGYAVEAETLADMTQWTKDQFVPRFKLPRDPRPGWKLVSVPAIYLSVMSQNLPILSRDEVNQIAVHLARHQEEDGTWLLPPPLNGAPPTWESPETLALWALLAWEPHVPGDQQEAAAARAGRDKAATRLGESTPSESNQAITLRLLLDVRTGKSAEQVQHGIDRLLARQNSNGGWSQTDDTASDAYATGQALWTLSFAGVKQDRPEIGRAVSFLIANQQEDGSWPMTPRNHPGVETTRTPVRNPVPITYFGSAWATIGLVRFVPTAPDTAARRQHAFDQIRAFHGKFELDETIADRPVVSVDLRYYELSDQEVAKFSEVLHAFPQLATLQFKSTKITDAGLTPLKQLPQLRSLTLENTAITDTGLRQLQVLTSLEELNLKGSKVSDAAVEEFQTAVPKVKVER